MPVLSKLIRVPGTFILEERKQMALTWMDWEQREGIPNRKMIFEACNIAYSTMMHATSKRSSIREGIQTKHNLTAGEQITLLTSWLQPPRHSVVEDMAFGLLLQKYIVQRIVAVVTIYPGIGGGVQVRVCSVIDKLASSEY